MSDELPDGWARVPIGDLFEINPKHSPTTELDTLVSFVPMPAVDEVEGRILPHSNRPLAEIWKGYTHFSDGDVIFAKITPCMENGKIAIAGGLTNGLACGSTEFHVFRPQGAALAQFLHRFLRRQSYRDDAEAAMTGAVGQRRVPRDFIANTEFPLPPRSEQQRIVAKIDSLFARSSKARDELARIPRLIERYKQAVLEAAFRGDLTADWRGSHPDEIPVSPNECRAEKRRGSRTAVAQLRADSTDIGKLPSTWVRSQIGSIARLQPGYAFKSDWFDSEGVRLLRGTNIVPDGTRWDDVAHLPYVMTDDYNEYRLHKGDIVIAMDRPLVSGGLKVARLSAVDLPALLLQRVGRFVLQPCVDPTFLWHFLHSDLFIAHIRDQATGSDLPHISATDIESVSIALPPLSEQRVIGEQLTTLLQSISAVGCEHHRATSMIDRLDQSILDKAFTGKLVPQDPNDEPASELLERIQAARAAAPKAKRGRKAKGGNDGQG